MGKNELWWSKYSPETLEGYIGNPVFVKNLEDWIEKGSIPNVILSGRAGIGKTTAANLITANIDCDSLYINASDENGIDTIRDKVKAFASAASFKPLKVIVLDEADFLTANAQSALRNIIETFSGGTRFVFTCNYFEKMLEPIQSRLDHYILHPPTKGELAKKCAEILKLEDVKYSNDDIVKLVNLTYPDNRQCLIKLQSFSKTGTLEIDDLQSNLDEAYNAIIKDLAALDRKRFNNIRQTIADLEIKDYSNLYRLLYDRMDDYTKNITIPWLIADYSHKSVTIPDKEVCFMGLIAKIMEINK